MEVSTRRKLLRGWKLLACGKQNAKLGQENARNRLKGTWGQPWKGEEYRMKEKVWTVQYFG